MIFKNYHDLCLQADVYATNHNVSTPEAIEAADAARAEWERLGGAAGFSNAGRRLFRRYDGARIVNAHAALLTWANRDGRAAFVKP